MSNDHTATAFIVSSATEKQRIENLRPDAQVLVLSFPLFAPDASKFITGKSKAKAGAIPDSELCLKSFEFKYKEQLEQFVTNTDEIVALAPDTENGMQWLAQAYRMGRMFIERDQPFRCARYIYLGDQALRSSDVTSPSPQELDTAFHKHVYNYITASWFRTYVLAPFHQRLAKSGRGALSLGGATTLLSVLALENKHTASIKSVFEASSAYASERHVFEFRYARDKKTKQSALVPVLPNLLSDPISLVAVDPIPTVILPNAHEFASARHTEYAERWCLENEQQDTTTQLLHSGVIALPSSDLRYSSQLKEAITNTRSLLAGYGLTLHDNQLDHTSLVLALLSATKVPLVVSSCDDELDMLFSHLREQSFLTYFKVDPLRNPRRVHVNPIDNATCGSVNNGYAVAVDVNDQANDYISLLGTYGFVTGPLRTSAPTLSASHDVDWLPNLLAILRENDVRSEYAMIVLRSLRKRKMLARVDGRFELTSYGFAYAHTLAGFLARMDKPYHKLLSDFHEAIEQSSNRAKTLERSLELAFDVISPMRALASKVDPPKKQVKKTGSDKKTTWTVVFDHADHIAYWQTRTGKRRAIWYKVKGMDAVDVSGIVTIKTKLDMFPKSEKKSVVVVPYQCSECLGVGVRITDSKENGKLKTTCMSCSAESKITTVTIIKEFLDG